MAPAPTGLTQPKESLSGFRLLAGLAVYAAVASSLGVMGHWLAGQLVLIVSAFLFLLFAVTGAMIGWKGEYRSMAASFAGALLCAIPAWWSFGEWSREHRDFHRLATAATYALAGGTPCAGLASATRVAELAAGIRGLEFEKDRIVWRGYSTRRNEIYDCATRRARET